MAATTYDFIVIGAGPAGCAVARRLAETKHEPNVLLIEAGSDNTLNTAFRHVDVKYKIAFIEPKLSWGYMTTPQEHLNDRQLIQARGKGLGGSSAVNFSVWFAGSQEDYNEWANIVGDSAWEWPEVAKRYRKIEKFEQHLPSWQKEYIDPSGRSSSGMVDLSFAREWDPNIELPTLTAAKQMKWPINKDMNSGDPVGFGIAANSWTGGKRISAAEAYLSKKLHNLTVLPDTAVAKIVFSRKEAVGVYTTSGKIYNAEREVILSAGALNSPQVLKLSGVGPRDELKKHNISVVQELPGVGESLMDHLYACMTQLLKPEAAENTSDASAIPIPIPIPNPQYQVGGQAPTGFLRSDAILKSDELSNLSPEVQAYLKRDKVPHYEVNALSQPIDPGAYVPQQNDRFRTIVTFLMNLQSQGTVTLASADPTAAPIINPNFLSHPYDRKLAIEAIRETMKFQASPAFKPSTEKVVCMPENDDDETLLAYWRDHAYSVFHMSGTVKMGPYPKHRDTGANRTNGHDEDTGSSTSDNTVDEMTCVTPDFRVKGVDRLRVADMSIAPLLPNNHTTSTAYLIGETCAEKIIAEYGLDE